MNILETVTNKPRCFVGAYSDAMVTLKGMTAPTPMPDRMRQIAKASKLCAKKMGTVKAAYTMMLTFRTCLRPNLSASHPATKPPMSMPIKENDARDPVAISPNSISSMI